MCNFEFTCSNLWNGHYQIDNVGSNHSADPGTEVGHSQSRVPDGGGEELGRVQEDCREGGGWTDLTQEGEKDRHQVEVCHMSDGKIQKVNALSISADVQWQKKKTPNYCYHSSPWT